MAIRITNTLTGEKEPFETLEPGKVSMYVCGPTVYDQAHIGHAMSAIVFDIIRRINKESERNERVTTIWEATEDDAAGAARGMRFKVVQIAGAVARRIDPWVEPGATLSKGERYGMIRLGSRVDTYLPAGVRPAVQAGERVKAGTTTLARRA
jgi:phosphatidylserine decarboxylase precursor-related protein